MKNKSGFILAILLLFSTAAFAQFEETEVTSEMSKENLFDSLYIEGVREFDKDFGKQDYQKAITALEEAVALEPDNPSAHYYLAYAYSGLNRKIAQGTSYRDKYLTIKTSIQMEAVIRLSPAFPAKLTLSPYSKITSEWASLALHYYHNNDLDSAFWAFSQGRKRGGFSEFMLNIHRTQLDQCPANAILFSKGDDNTFNFLYLQVIENHRTDIAVIDLDLINKLWYQNMLIQRNIVSFIPSTETREGYHFVSWNDTIIEVPIASTGRIFSWDFEARGSNPFYLYYGDLALMSMISTNQFQRPVLFTDDAPNEDYHNLWSEVRDEILSKRIAPFEKKRLPTQSFDSLSLIVMENVKDFNKNSYDERLQLNNIRKSILNRIYLDWLSNVDSDKENAKRLLIMLTTKLPASDYPCIDEETANMIKDFERVILGDSLAF